MAFSAPCPDLLSPLLEEHSWRRPCGSWEAACRLTVLCKAWRDEVNAWRAFERTVRLDLRADIAAVKVVAKYCRNLQGLDLRGCTIKQLGTTYLVFPGALHTRFDHSIGTVHVTQKMIDAINLSFELDPAGTVQVSEEEARVIRIAALLHDITHIPSGHNIEDQDGLFERHDSAYRYRRMFERTEVGRVLDELGVREEGA